MANGESGVRPTAGLRYLVRGTGYVVRQRALLASLLTVGAAGHGVPGTTLSAWTGSRWETIWETTRPRLSWDNGSALINGALHWKPAGSGLEWAELFLSGDDEARRTRVILARVDPVRVRLVLENGLGAGGAAPVWTLDQAPPGASLALNAGQFEGGGVWGWVVHQGTEYRVPRRGPLAAAVVIDTAGRISLENDAQVAARRAGGSPAGVREAFQSYPLLLQGDGDLPPALRPPGGGLDLAHRDARLALGIDRTGRVIVALTRFDFFGEAMERLPFGLTIPETAALMGALGCRQAVALDGGISAQLLVHPVGGDVRLWRGLRPVPLALVGYIR